MAERTIGGNTFIISPLPAFRSFALQPRIAPAVAAAIKTLFGVATELRVNDLADLERDVAPALILRAFAPAVGEICQLLPSKELDAIVRELLSTALIRTPRGETVPLLEQFDTLMQGRTVDTWRLIAWAVQVNYPDFFALFGGARAAPAASPS